MVKNTEVDKFESDPFGYCSTVWHEWVNVQMRAGHHVNLEKSPTSEELKNPIFWICQANSLSESAKILIRTTPDFSSMPKSMYSICYRQYMASALMMLGYSLELMFKGLSIQQFGVETYTKNERKYFSHKLPWLVRQHIQITAKEEAILKCLTHFLYWAGRYPDHGTGKESELEDIFKLSESNQISMKELSATLDRLVKFATGKIISSSQ
ncbi:hypothetical protein [Paraglaciecola chathamensis]|uniref:HEPN domain-containing protein n=1 Tax=Paraglaciecola chathamensis S18K6 TaxID=1127672 RepID=A0AAV3UWD7_9ALTE|nr:hypothetical protein [Paraglaciecola chathamensis]GAC09523.1 hypothetical protein GCHA_1569 [Paraglaciecola chathamensis S18K6]